MTDLLFPPWVRISASSPKQVSNTAVSRSIFTGAARTLDRTGHRWRLAFGTQNANAAEAAALTSFVANLKGMSNRVWLGMPGYKQRGSFPAPELLTNNTFLNGVAGWLPGGLALSNNDRILRMTMNGAAGVAFAYQTTSNMSVNAPSALRFFMKEGIGSLLSAGAFNSYVEGAGVASNTTTTNGLITLSLVPDSTSGNQYAIYSTSGGYPTSSQAGYYIDMLYSSMARCALVDNGANLLLRSDEFDNAAWGKTNVTVSADTGATTDPQGTNTADNIVETTATGNHYTSQAAAISASAADYCFGVALKTNGRPNCWVQLGTASGAVTAYFSMSTGVAGTAVVGSGWANLRTFTKNAGNGWFIFYIVARKTSADTSLIAYVGAATADAVSSYTGNTGNGMFNWRATLSQSSVPTRLVQSTSAAVAATAQTGPNLYVKGLPASTSGLLLPGDLDQVGNQLQKVVASLDSDAAGLGYLQMHRSLRTAPADNDPVIVNNPMGRFVAVNAESGWDDMPGKFSNFQFDFEEALDT